MNSSARKKLRKELRARRRSLPTSHQAQSSRDIIRQLYRQIFFIKARNVGLYWPTDGEADISGLTLADDTAWYLPQISDSLRRWENQRLFFQLFDPDRTALNTYGIIEPCYNPRFHLDPLMLDVVLVPLVGFDRQGNRLGMGKGYYDRTFENRHKAWHKPRLVGIAYSIQECAELSSNAWDIPLQAIVTEREVIYCSDTAVPTQQNRTSVARPSKL
ncbi:MAG: 5-formyltetrahydrofolate cyclo-ligase [bacterium]